MKWFNRLHLPNPAKPQLLEERNECFYFNDGISGGFAERIL